MPKYLIVNRGDGQDAGSYWSSNHGWTSSWEADHFSDEDKATLDLPVDGQWVIVASEHPKCSQCGGEEFQLVEDVPVIYRSHEFVDGQLAFSVDDNEQCFEAAASAYRYVECRSCCTRLEDVPFSFDDGFGETGPALSNFGQLV